MDIVEVLWREGGEKLAQIKDNDGQTAYEYAYEENQLEPYEYLCDRLGIKTKTYCTIF